MSTTKTMGLAALILALGASTAFADDDLVDMEVAVPIAIADRATTGTDDELHGYGYDDQTGLMSGLEMRLYTSGMNRYLRLGVIAGAQHHAGPAFGLAGGHAFRTTLFDAGITARTVFPCMSSDEVRWHLSGLLAMSGMYADAGTGVGAQPNGPDEDARAAAARELDHAGLGWRLAVDLSIHFDHFLVGLGMGVRQMFGIDTVASRTWVADIGLRLGGRIDFTDARAF